MATIIENPVFSTRTGARASRYNWDELLDGQARNLVRGTDFASKPENFKTLAAATAKNRGQGVLVNLYEDALDLQAYALPAQAPVEAQGVELTPEIPAAEFSA